MPALPPPTLPEGSDILVVVLVAAVRYYLLYAANATMPMTVFAGSESYLRHSSVVDRHVIMPIHVEVHRGIQDERDENLAL